MQNIYKLLIIDDFQLSALGTKALLAGHSMNFEIFTAFSVDEGISVLEQIPIDVVLCDIFMPEKDGFELLDHIKKDFPKVKLMFLSISEDKEVIYKALAYGADGYQFKDVSKDELINSLGILISGKKYYNPRIIDVLYNDLSIYAANVLSNNPNLSSDNILNLYNNKRQSSRRELSPSKLPNIEEVKKLLTTREIEILELVGEDVPTKEIAERLNISSFTVSTHRKNMYTKLGLETLTQMKSLARELNAKNAG